MFSKESLLCELLENPEVMELFNQIAPGMAESPAMEFMKGMSIAGLMENAPVTKRPLYQLLIDAANGEDVSFVPVDPADELPEIMGDTHLSYDIDDVDGAMYMLEHQFSGCLIIQFTKTMNEDIYGKVTCDGVELPQGLIKAIEIAGGMQMCGIPVRQAFGEYNREYRLLVEGFQDTYGNVMKPQELIVKTQPKPMPDPAYEAHDEVALQAAREGIVLLKNQEGILPLAADVSLQLVLAEQFRVGAVGAGRINPRYNIGLKRAIEDYSQFQISDTGDIGIIVISRPSGENFDNNAMKGEYYLSDEEEQRIKTLSNSCNKVIAILNTGYPMDVRWLDKYHISAAIWCGFPGMLGGKALVEILDGRENPSGKLPDTWSLDYWDIPASANFYQPESPELALGADGPEYLDTYYEEDIYVGYRYFETFEKEVAYPFGYGLSYTNFQLHCEMASHHHEGANEVIVRVKNTGYVPGKEVVQVYVAIPDGKLEQPSLRLAGFAKTRNLRPDECQEMKIMIPELVLTSYDESNAAWILEAGDYIFCVGTSVKELTEYGTIRMEETRVVKQVENLMRPPVHIDVLTKENEKFPEGKHSGIKADITSLAPKGIRRHYQESEISGTKPEREKDFVDKLSIEELARLSVCASHGWGMHQKGEAGRIYRLNGYELPEYVVADGNNGVNVKKPNIGMPCSNTVCATWNTKLAYQVGAVIAEEAKENDIQMILAPAMNIHRNPLNGRHPEYFSEDPYLSGIMAGNQSKGLEEHGVSSCIKHAVANNCEAARKRNHSIMTERALREIYLKVYEVAMSVHQPDSMMTAYNAANGVYTAADEEMIQGIFRKEFGFRGFVMTDWSSYDTADVAESIQAGNCWMTPGTADNTYVTPIVEGVKAGKIDEQRLRSNVRYLLRIVQKRTGKELGVK